MNSVFQIDVRLDDQVQQHWTISDDLHNLASMLGESLEASQGATITVKPADLQSLRLLTESVGQVTACCQCQEDIGILVKQIIRVLLPIMAMKNPSVFLQFYFLCNSREFSHDGIRSQFGRTVGN